MIDPLKSRDQVCSLSVRALIFDMDGTLVETEQASDQIWRRWADRHGLDVAPLIHAARGRRTIDTMREFCPVGLSPEEETALIEREELEQTEGIFAVGGALAFLNSIPQDRWAIVTSNTRSLANIRLRAVGIEPPSILVTSEAVSRGKPDPEGYLRAAKALGCEPADVVVFEDSRAGVEAAKASGASVIVIEPLPSLARQYAGYQIVDFDDLRLTISSEDEMLLNIRDNSAELQRELGVKSL